MNNNKKIAFQERMIENLEKQNRDLMSENKAVSKENERNKRLLELKEKELSYLRESVSEMQAEYYESLEQVRLLRENLNSAIKAANAAKKQFEKKSRDLLNKFKRIK